MESINTNLSWGIDIGGSFAKIGYLRGTDGTFTLVEKIPTGKDSTPTAILSKIVSTILEIDTLPKSIGFGLAGMISKSTKTVQTSANLPLWNGVDIQTTINNFLDIPIEIDNDSNVFAIGSIHSGSIPNKGLWLFITLGTGIGGTIIYNGQVIYGTDFAGEFGHTSICADGKACSCGSKGCWEKYAGTDALKAHYKKLSTFIAEPVSIAQRAREGDNNAISSFTEYGKWLGLGMANLANIFSPNGFFLGGGIASAFNLFEKSALHEFNNRCNHRWSTRVLTNSYTAGAYGAAIMASNPC